MVQGSIEASSCTNYFWSKVFMTESPRTAIMFSTAWITMLGIVVMMIVPNFPVNIPYFMLFIFLCWIYSVIICEIGLYKILHGKLKSKISCLFLAMPGALFYPFIPLLIIPGLTGKRRIFSIFAAIAGIIFYCANYALGLLSIIFILIATAGVEDKQKFSWRFMFPVTTAIALIVFTASYIGYLKYDIRQTRMRISHQIGRSIEVDDFWMRDNKGFPQECEPLKPILNTQLDKFDFPHSQDLYNRKLVRKKLAELNQLYPEYIKALDKLFSLPVSGVSHKNPGKDGLTALHLSELTAFRHSGYFVQMKIIADPENKQNVALCNGQLIALRDWTVKSPTIISFSTAISLEYCRIKSLGFALASGKYTKDEFHALLGTSVDWHKYLLFAFGDEATSFQTTHELMQQILLNVGKKYLFAPLSGVSLLLDYRFALQYFEKLCNVSPKLYWKEKFQLTTLDKKTIKRNNYTLSSMLLPAINAYYKLIANNEDFRQSAIIAAEIMEFRNRHGKLPESLEFLPYIPKTKMNNENFCYEKMDNGFQIFSLDENGKIPLQNTPYRYEIIIPD